MTVETATLYAFLSVNLKVVFLALPILPSHVSPPRLRITFYVKHIARYKFYIVLYCIVLYASTTSRGTEIRVQSEEQTENIGRMTLEH